MLAVGNEKYCPSCEEIKHIKNFGPDKNRGDGLRTYCYECRRFQNKKYYYKDVEKSRKSGRERTKRHRNRHPEVVEKQRNHVKDWYHSNKKYAIERRRKWRQTPSGRYSVMKMNQKRRINMKNSVIDISLNEIEFLLVLQNNECAKCEKEFTNKRKYTLDHIIPVSLGGDLILENTQLLCRSCNASKSDTIIMYRPNINFRCLSFI
jgi:5-methylcytosine-specific restriction endonuclease McrA